MNECKRCKIRFSVHEQNGEAILDVRFCPTCGNSLALDLTREQQIEEVKKAARKGFETIKETEEKG